MPRETNIMTNSENSDLAAVAAASASETEHDATTLEQPQSEPAGSVDLHVLTVMQPWADEILFGKKWCENRIWSTNYRGPLYIHAGTHGTVMNRALGLV